MAIYEWSKLDFFNIFHDMPTVELKDYDFSTLNCEFNMSLEIPYYQKIKNKKSA